MTRRSQPSPIKYCPRCDHRCLSPESDENALARLDEHVKNSHPNYYAKFWKDKE